MKIKIKDKYGDHVGYVSDSSYDNYGYYDANNNRIGRVKDNGDIVDNYGSKIGTVEGNVFRNKYGEKIGSAGNGYSQSSSSSSGSSGVPVGDAGLSLPLGLGLLLALAACVVVAFQTIPIAFSILLKSPLFYLGFIVLIEITFLLLYKGKFNKKFGTVLKGEIWIIGIASTIITCIFEFLEEKYDFFEYILLSVTTFFLCMFVTIICVLVNFLISGIAYLIVDKIQTRNQGNVVSVAAQKQVNGTQQIKWEKADYVPGKKEGIIAITLVGLAYAARVLSLLFDLIHLDVIKFVFMAIAAVLLVIVVIFSITGIKKARAENQSCKLSVISLIICAVSLFL